MIIRFSMAGRSFPSVQFNGRPGYTLKGWISFDKIHIIAYGQGSTHSAASIAVEIYNYIEVYITRRPKHLRLVLENINTNSPVLQDILYAHFPSFRSLPIVQVDWEFINA